jgi:hypothetical protein
MLALSLQEGRSRTAADCFQVNRVKPARPNKIKKAKTTPPTAFAGWQRRYRWIFLRVVNQFATTAPSFQRL